MAGQFAVLLADDMPSFYAGFAALGFAAFGLVAHKGTAEALRAGRVYIVFVVLGELALFAAFVLIAAGQPGLAAPVETGLSPPVLAWWLLLFGFGVKAGLVPLHVWLPLAHPVAPVPASAALSGATLKAGLIGLLVYAPATLAAPLHFGETMVALGFAGAFGAALLGVTQPNPKVVLAYSSVSQMGLALAILGAAAAGWADPDAARAAVLLFAVHHALAKGALFLGVAPGLSRALSLVVLGYAALSLTGAPLTPGYAAKTAAAAAAPVLADAMAVAAWGTAALMARTLWLLAGQQRVETDRSQATAFAAVAAALVGTLLWLRLDTVPTGLGSALVALAPALTALAGGALAIRVGWSLPAVVPGDLLALMPRWASLVSPPPAPRAEAAPAPIAQPPTPLTEPDEDVLWRRASYGMAATLAALGLAALWGAPG
jgi:formate hydrogenlyase subunit 3/multisubunit Na+/H+ antiporter MnhD subunit